MRVLLSQLRLAALSSVEMTALSTDIAVIQLGKRLENAFTRSTQVLLSPFCWTPNNRRSFLKCPKFARYSGGTKKNGHSSRVINASKATEDAECLDVLGLPKNRIPTTIITGFLGSGKTTLLNHILTSDHGKRIAVIENEYGEVDIDGSLVASRDTGAEDIVMLNNGCICCTVRGDLVRMISELVEKKAGAFDHIVIETTGLANPAPIIQTFYTEEKIFNSVKLDGVVTLVDAKNALRHLDELKPSGVVNEAIGQIAYADRIIVNKTDLVSDTELTPLIDRITKINRMARLKGAEFGNVRLDYVLGIGGFDVERFELDTIEDPAAASNRNNNKKHNHDDHHPHEKCQKHVHQGHQTHGHSHDPSITSVSLVCEGNLDIDKINDWLGEMLYNRSKDIYRIKGILAFRGTDERHVFQGVHDIFQLHADRPWRPDEPRISKIVFIGLNLDAKKLNKGLRNCIVRE